MSQGDPRVLFDSQTLRIIDQLTAEETSQDLVKTVSVLRSEGHPPERIHHALEQVRLRRKARAKFGEFANTLLFTEAGLEQATRLAVAAHHTGRFHSAGIRQITDVGCGIGSDSLAFVGLGMAVRAIEIDPFTAAIASYNLAAFEEATVEIADALSVDLSDSEALWIDPARRNSDGLLRDPSEWSPPLTRAYELARNTPSGIKLAPGMDRALIPDGVEAQWVSVSGEVVEMVLWWNSVARSGVTRSALLISDTASYEMTAAGDSADARVAGIGSVIYEPDGAIIRARLLGDLARKLDGWMIDSTIAYISSSEYQPTPFAQAFRVKDSFPYNHKTLASYIRDANVARLEIKKRGIDIDPAELRKSLPLKGQGELTVILTRESGQKTAIIAERIRD